jgi:hypothetical protein
MPITTPPAIDPAAPILNCCPCGDSVGSGPSVTIPCCPDGSTPHVSLTVTITPGILAFECSDCYYSSYLLTWDAVTATYIYEGISNPAATVTGLAYFPRIRIVFDPCVPSPDANMTIQPSDSDGNFDLITFSCAVGLRIDPMTGICNGGIVNATGTVFWNSSPCYCSGIFPRTEFNVTVTS